MLVFCLTVIYNGFLVKGAIFCGFQDCVLEFFEKKYSICYGVGFWGFQDFSKRK
jgi:hypothetical protein